MFYHRLRSKFTIAVWKYFRITQYYSTQRRNPRGNLLFSALFYWVKVSI